MTNPAAKLRLSWLSVWPVVQRELRAGSRSAFNYWIRLIAGGIALLAVCSWMGAADNLPPSEQGIALFCYLHFCLLALVLVFVPAMTADCLARERREGTLGLLFMTPLKPTGVAIGKSLVHGLRAWCLWLSVLPALVLPFVLGGITWDTIVKSMTLEFAAILIGLSSGLMASCVAKQFYTAVVMAEILALFACLALVMLFGQLANTWFASTGTGMQWRSFSMDQLAMVIAVASGIVPTSALAGVVIPSLDYLAVGFALSALMFLALALKVAAYHIKRSWQEKPPSVRHQRWSRILCTEFFRDRFKRKMRKALQQNPIAWLQQYSWKARVGKWGTCLLFVFLQSLAMMGIANNFFNFNIWSIAQETEPVQLFITLFVAVLYTYAGVSSFIAEKNSGALELILITPITVSNIIWGRAIGLWKQFLPTAITLLGLQAAICSIDYNNYRAGMPWSLDWMLGCAFLTLPIYATYAALRVRWTIGGITLTWIALLVAWAFACSAAQYSPFYSRSGYYHPDASMARLAVWFTFSSIGFSALTFFMLHHSLSRRIYSF